MTRGFGILVVLATTTAAGCVTTTRTAKPLQVANHAAAIVRDGRAEVHTQSGPLAVSASEVVHVRLRDPDGVERPVRLTIGELVAGCVEDTLAPGCLAARAIDDPMVLRRKTRVSSGKVASLIALGVTGSALGYCAVACDSGDEDGFRNGALVAGGVVALGAFVFLTVGTIAR
jgi:hypothetical protein